MKIGDLDTHPLADVFGLMDDAMLAQHADDIEANGQMVPIVLAPDGRILDGRNTLKACLMRGIEPQFRQYGSGPCETGTDLQALARWVWSHNGSRRDLSPGARALAVRRIVRIITVRKPRQSRQPLLPGVKEETQHEAEIVLGGASPEMVAAIERGDIDIRHAAEAVQLGPEAQKAVVDGLQVVRSKAVELSPEDMEALRDGYDKLGEHPAARLLERMVPEI